jgi:hypothetical protein
MSFGHCALHMQCMDVLKLSQYVSFKGMSYILRLLNSEDVEWPCKRVNY